MATTTSIIHNDSPDTGIDVEKYTKIARTRIRNMVDFKRIKDTKVVVPTRTISNPSPLKKTASNRHPGQTHTRTQIDGAMNHELANARLLMHDLADHVFGHLVSTKLAGDILLKFVQDKVIQVFDGKGSRGFKVPLHPNSDEAHRAVQQAFENANWYDCIQEYTKSAAGSPEGSPTDTTTKRKQKAKTYSFNWTKFPMEPLCEDELVSFLNDTIDRAFTFAKPKLAVTSQRLHHRFAAPGDKHHAVPLSYEPDGEDMRPDFLLLPIEAFSQDLKTVDAKYINFTAARLVGESKNKDMAAGIEQMQRYARGLKRAQPWVYCVLGMAVTKDRMVFMRGEGSGTECLDLTLTDGRCCIEVIRILLGLALANQIDLGHNPDVVLGWREQSCKALNIRRSNASTSKVVSRLPGNDRVVSVPDSLSGIRMSETHHETRPQSDSVTFRGNATSSSTKRDHSEDADGSDERKQSKKRKTTSGESAVKDVDRFVFYPDTVYGHKCSGTLFTASSIRGRGTTVFSVLRGSKRMALRMAWQDVTRMAEQDAVMKRLKDQGSRLHPNVIVPFISEKVEKGGDMCTTLGAIRGFLDSQMEEWGVENRVLTVSVSELKRPVKYFWGVHDFVRGLRGAILGHEYLTKIGILHRDISENNIVLGLRPEEERGYLIDLDMAILQDAEEPTQPEPVELQPLFSRRSVSKSSTALEPTNKKHMRALRTGTFPYISYNVLWGGKHTQFDDVESFLYVLLLFFFSYAGSLPVPELGKADEAGFVHSIGAGRSSHMKSWPRKYAGWADGEAEVIADQKCSAITTSHGADRIIESTEFMDCLENNWPKELHDPISDLIHASFTIFYRSTLRTVAKGSRTEVSHSVFIDMLDEWLNLHSQLEDKYSNCPFKEPKAES